MDRQARHAVEESGGQCFRLPLSALVVIVLSHSIIWSALAAIGGVSFASLPEVCALGGLIGCVHAAMMWLMTSVTIAGGKLITRNFAWTREILLDDISVVQVVQQRGLRGVSIRLVDDEEFLLAAPYQSLLVPNALFGEELRRLCAAVLLHSGGVAEER